MSESKPTREGDILGISDADPHAAPPTKSRRGRRRPQGIEVGERATGIGDVPQRSGASGADIGGGEGANVDPDPPDVEETPDSVKD